MSSEVLESTVKIETSLDECQLSCEPVPSQPITCRLVFRSTKPISFTKHVIFCDSLGNRFVLLLPVLYPPEFTTVGG